MKLTAVLVAIALALFTTVVARADEKADIVTTAVKAGKFNTLVTAVKAAGLVQTLESPGPFTVFAPTDAAFAALPAGTLDALLADKTKLTAILTYHVVAGNLQAKDVLARHNLKTVNGASLKVDKNGTVNGVKIVMTDIECSNGVIHVIDAVLLPPAVKADNDTPTTKPCCAPPLKA